MLKASSWGCCRRPACQPSNTASLTKAAARARRWASCECVSPRARPRPACQRRTKSSQPSAARSKSTSVCFCRRRSSRSIRSQRKKLEIVISRFRPPVVGPARGGSKWAICAHLAARASGTPRRVRKPHGHVQADARRPPAQIAPIRTPRRLAHSGGGGGARRRKAGAFKCLGGRHVHAGGGGGARRHHREHPWGRR